jgi:hypothetical protein
MKIHNTKIDEDTADLIMEGEGPDGWPPLIYAGEVMKRLSSSRFHSKEERTAVLKILMDVLGDRFWR